MSMTIYASCAAGWGKGKTIAEALRNMKNFSRGFIEKDYTQKLNRTKMDIADLLEDGTIRLWATDDPEPQFGKLGSVTIGKGYHYVTFGDENNEANIYTEGKENGNG